MGLTGPDKAYTDVFDVLDAAPPSIICLADAKQTLSMDPAYTDDDDELRGKLRAVTTSVERYMRTVYSYRVCTEIIDRPRMGVPWLMAAALRLTFVPVIPVNGSITSLVTLNPDGSRRDHLQPRLTCGSTRSQGSCTGSPGRRSPGGCKPSTRPG